jgi:hypothetical protein
MQKPHTWGEVFDSPTAIYGRVRPADPHETRA